MALTGYFIDPSWGGGGGGGDPSRYLATNLQKPILLEGPAGSGKHPLAVALAAGLWHTRGAAAVLSRR